MNTMEWVETTARTVDEAKDLLLDQLGVDQNDAEFDVLEEPKPGLFGRTKGQARVRARVKPKTPPSRDDRRRRKGKDKEKASGDAAAPTDTNGDDAPRRSAAPKPSKTVQQESVPEREAAERLDSNVAVAEATTFLEGILQTFGVEGTITMSVDDAGDLSAEINGSGLGRLIGPRGGVISAIEELTRTRLQHVASGGPTPRFKVDVGGYRAQRRTNLERFVDDVIVKVRESGQPHVLDVVMSGERKLVHDRVGEQADDLTTHSEGEDPVRRVVVSISAGSNND
ncbi:MAG: Jag N-terminal domain-containing protein [Microthrixaceae bacterium]|nr:Jag N-terminal domain-containing protein [Microthrixaceae bacterium]